MVGLAGFGLTYLAYLYYDVIPEVAGINITQVLMAGLLMGSFYAILAALGINIAGEESENT